MQIDHIYWIGGSPCSGKSTLTDMLVEEYNFIYYKVDDHLDRYINIGAERNIPLFKRYQTMSLDQIWLERDVSTQVQEEFEFYRHAFQFILDDINSPAYQIKPLIIEGAALTPNNVAKLNIDSLSYLAIIPTPEFQLEKYEQRPWVKGYLANCSNPKQAFQNWMARDVQFAQQVQAQAQYHSYRTIITDSTRSIEDTYQLVKHHFQLF